jgi:hypothetical protein
MLKFEFQVTLHNIELLPDLLECNYCVIWRVSLLTSVWVKNVCRCMSTTFMAWCSINFTFHRQRVTCRDYVPDEVSDMKFFWI